VATLSPLEELTMRVLESEPRLFDVMVVKVMEAPVVFV